MKLRYIVISIIAIILLFFVWIYYTYVSPYKAKYEWNQNYFYNNDQPYGLNYLFETLKSSSSKRKIDIIDQSVIRQMKWGNSKNNCYVFIGNKYEADSAELRLLFKFLSEGNMVFISSNSIPAYITRLISSNECTNECISATYGNTIKTSFVHSEKNVLEYNFHYQFLKDTPEYFWSYFNDDFLNEIFYNRSYDTLSLLNNLNVNFIKLNYGKGTIYLHSNPIFFTNYHFVNESGFNYANTALSFIDDKHIYWDEINKIQEYSDHGNGNGFNPSESPFRYILSQTSFRWAWYLLIFLLLLFVLFGSKRKQKPIPLIEENKNSSVEYTKAVASLYYQSNDHTFIAKEMWRLFFNFVKIKYSIDLNNQDVKPDIALLSYKSKISESKIEQIIKLKNEVCFNQGKDKNLLIEFQEILTNFYKNCS